MKVETGTNSFGELFQQQLDFQTNITGVTKPVDDVMQFVYHMNAMTEELGEVLKADKRWKTHRNARYEPQEKIEEIADVFITAINISLYSGFSGEQIFRAIQQKIQKNTKNLLEDVNKYGK